MVGKTQVYRGVFRGEVGETISPFFDRVLSSDRTREIYRDASGFFAIANLNEYFVIMSMNPVKIQ
jgi:hypothetical protein